MSRQIESPQRETETEDQLGRRIEAMLEATSNLTLIAQRFQELHGSKEQPTSQIIARYWRCKTFDNTVGVCQLHTNCSSVAAIINVLNAKYTPHAINHRTPFHSRILRLTLYQASSPAIGAWPYQLLRLHSLLYPWRMAQKMFPHMAGTTIITARSSHSSSLLSHRTYYADRQLIWRHRICVHKFSIRRCVRVSASLS